jgi:hypothetical protein
VNAPLFTFRVHFGDGETVDISAATPTGARVEAMRRFPSAIISKIKVVRS